MKEILGYKSNGEPIHPIGKNMMATACIVSCSACRKVIRGMGGPIQGAVCISCHEKNKHPPTLGGEPIQRYDLSPLGYVMNVNESGAFVCFEDHRAHVTRLQAELSLFKDTDLKTEALREQEDEIVRLRGEVSQLIQHKNDFMEAAEETQKALQAEVERLKGESKRLAELDDSVIKQLGDRLRASEARNTELEGLLRKQAEHIVILAENTLSYSSGIGSPIKTKEVNDAVYVALMHQQAVNAALAEGKEHE